MLRLSSILHTPRRSSLCLSQGKNMIQTTFTCDITRGICNLLPITFYAPLENQPVRRCGLGFGAQGRISGDVRFTTSIHTATHYDSQSDSALSKTTESCAAYNKKQSTCFTSSGIPVKSQKEGEAEIDITRSGIETDSSMNQSIEMEKILVHYVCGYAYCPVDNPQGIRREILESFATLTGIGGRIYVSTNGMNVQLSVPNTTLSYVREVIHSLGGGVFKSKIRLFSMDPTLIIGDEMFSNLTIRVRPLLNEGLDRAFSDSLDEHMETMKHLHPEQWHKELALACKQIESAMRYQQIKYGDGAETEELRQEEAESQRDADDKKNEHKPPIILDVRNLYEYEVGGFKGAIPVVVDAFRHTFTEIDRILGLPPIEVISGSTSDTSTGDHDTLEGFGSSSRLHITAIENPALSQAEALVPRPSKPVESDRKMFLYCTGGIRCMKVGAYLVSRGFKDVNVLEGGVNSYAQYIQMKYPEGEERDANSLFKGTNVMFDSRKGTRITNDVLSKCHQCGEPCDMTRNCNHNTCDLLLIQCSRCEQAYKGCCSIECATKIGASMQTDLLPEGLEVIETAPSKERVRPRISPLTRPVEGVIF